MLIVTLCRVAWRSAYLTRLGSLRNRMMVVSNWLITMLLVRMASF